MRKEENQMEIKNYRVSASAMITINVPLNLVMSVKNEEELKEKVEQFYREAVEEEFGYVDYDELNISYEEIKMSE